MNRENKIAMLKLNINIVMKNSIKNVIYFRMLCKVRRLKMLKQSLRYQMEAKRQLMIVSANKFGFTSSETIRYSQELDQLMNVYLHVIQSDKEQNYPVKEEISYSK